MARLTIRDAAELLTDGSQDAIRARMTSGRNAMLEAVVRELLRGRCMRRKGDD